MERESVSMWEISFVVPPNHGNDFFVFFTFTMFLYLFLCFPVLFYSQKVYFFNNLSVPVRKKISLINFSINKCEK
jgi:hypothetical protein